jgi:hypothetical protein
MTTFCGHVKSEYVIKKTLDHKPVQLTIETPEGEDGHQRHTINEDMILEPQIQSHITRLVDDAYEKSGNQTKKWERAHASVRDFLLKETAKRKKVNRKKLKGAKAQLKLIELKINKRGTSETLAALRATVVKEIHQLEHPERTEIHEEAQAKRCAEKSDKCSRLMFSSYKQIAKQQHINKVKTTREWKEGEEPTFTGHTTKPDQVCAELMKSWSVLV